MTITAPSTFFGWLLSALILIGALPMLCSVFQFFLVGLHRWFSHYDRADPAHMPRVAVLVPAWNEALVLDFSVERMMALDYPQDRLRLVIVDDASTDDTPDLLREKQERYPGRIVVLRRQQGGQGKSHTLNHGLDVILDDDWAEAVLITDADVVFAPDAIAKLARHLADPEVGAVMGFIREASAPPHWLSRYIGYEYATAQLAARRAQNVIGAQACLAGGAQLLSRDNLEAQGGRIDTTTLAEDTVTTFLTQLGGRKVIFDPNAQCFAEEPASVTGLWKQRLRWSRGNLQVSRRFHSVFFRRSTVHHLGNAWLGLQWYSTLLLPAFMVLVSVALVVMWLFDAGDANLLFRIFWSISAFAFVFTTTFTLTLDRRVAARSWRQAFVFPGLVNLSLMAYVIAPGPMHDLIRASCEVIGLGWTEETRSLLALFAYAWTSLCMLFAWLIFRLDRLTWMRPVLSVFMLVVGFGPFLCSITFAAYVAQLRGAATTWDKTEKTGKVGIS
ncbi:glycosyltransferase [Tessaracoccus antarcticus]|uniref:Glycosyltransferase family 2 protein n=1 Tax=Tessaracoccus antarcticus TaxID=2479848 RepID=A0A3M0G7V2_9ACTN|nr:glycosyltransferase family 2 protein [Tessaracoccus antarcticus]RMB60207.1 glycosyltransferase family 2 protein [Tessaracoccus antarcticus]